MKDNYEPDLIRTPIEVARRALALFPVTGLAFGAPRANILDWLDEAELWADLTPSEKRFIDAPQPSRQERINAGWLSEGLMVLCWALGEIEHLPEADKQCDTAIFEQILPPFADREVWEFVGSATLRSDRHLKAMVGEMLTLHGQARNEELTGIAPLSPIDIGVVRERHRAINWVIGYDDLPWDEVTTDT